MDIKTLLEELIESQEVLDALSEVGVFISNFRTGENLNSHIWKDPPNSLNLECEDTWFMENIHPDDRERIRMSFDAVTHERLKAFHEIYRMKGENGEYRWVSSKGRTVGEYDGGKSLLFVGSDRDISKLKEAEVRLTESIRDEKQRSGELEILRQISGAINSTMDRDEVVRRTLAETRRIIPFDSGSIQLLKDSRLHVVGAEGFTNPEQVMSLSFSIHQAGSLSTRAIQEGKPFLSSDVIQDFPAFIQPDLGSVIRSWIGVPLISHGTNIGLMALDGHRIGQFSSHHLELAEMIGDQIAMAMERSLLHEKAYSMAMTDSLTTVGSRHRLEMEGRLLFEAAARNEKSISVALLDIDHFKKVNDRYGHDEGDNVLKKIADICSTEIRAMDSLCRFGGEEFVLIMPETNQEQAFLVLDRLRKTVGRIDHSAVEGSVTVSIGFCSGIPVHGQGIESFLTRADKALYHSKENGRNQVSGYSAPHAGKIVARE